MNKIYWVNYQSKDRQTDFHQQLPTREEAEELALELQNSEYENIIIEELRT